MQLQDTKVPFNCFIPFYSQQNNRNKKTIIPGFKFGKGSQGIF